jgi:hypothetical protein
VEIINYIGIDPGQKGAIAILHSDKKTIDYYDMPLLPNGEIDERGIEEILTNLVSPFCTLEKAQTMPGQGSIGGFNYGVGYGTIKTTLRFMRIPFQEISPMKWKKEFSLIRAKDKKIKGMSKEEKAAYKSREKKLSKEESATKVLELFPEIKRDDLYTERGRLLDGRAEAILICEYGRRIHYGDR